MAQRGQKDLLARLADAGEDALTRLAASPGMDRVTGVVTNLRDQVDTLANKVRGMDALERRIEELERKVAQLSKQGGTSRSTTARKKTGSSTARKTGGASKKKKTG
jgi:polyhydroxyalkanoate synthesis regulator phasin